MRRWWVWAALVAATIAGAWWLPRWIRSAEAPLVVGLIHSKTGPLGAVELGILDAEILALEEINADGGLLGRRLEWKIADGRSDPREFGREARRLIDSEKAVMIAGGLTSASRVAMEEATIPARVLLIHAGLFEGMEDAVRWFGVGPLPNQQAVPAVSWCLESLGARKFFLAGIRDVSSYAVHAVVRDQLKALGGEVVGEGFVGLDGAGAGDLVAAMKASRADVAVSTIVGDANVDLFKRFADAGLTPKTLPIMNLRVSEEDLLRLPADQTTGHYAAWAYFQSMSDETSNRLVGRFKARFGADRVIGGPAASAYYGVKLWAQAVRESLATDLDELTEHLARQSLRAGDQVLAVDHDMVHAWRPIHVGKIRRDGQIEEVWSMDRSIRPVAYPIFRSNSAWRAAVAKWRATDEPGIDAPPSAPAPDAAPTPRPPAAASSSPTAGAPVVWGPRGTVRATPPAAEPPRSAAAARPRPRAR